MLNESDITMMWRKLFHGREITGETLAQAEALLDGLSPESPLRLRLTTELKEIRTFRQQR